MKILAGTKNFKEYFKELILLAFPMIIGNLGQVLIGATDVFVASKHSINTLSAISIANAIMFCIYIIGIGLMAGISIVLSNKRGSGKPTKKTFMSVINLALLLSVMLSAVSFVIIPLVDAFGFEKSLVPLIKEYMFICSFSFAGMYVYQAIKEFLQAHEIVNFPNMILIVALALNMLLDFALVFGFGFIPALGVKGLAIATLTVRTLMGLVMLVYARRLLVQESSLFDLTFIKQVLKIGYPIGFALLLEFLGFNLITIIVGKTSGVLASCHNIATTIMGINFMIPLSLSNAVAIKVGYCNGAKDYKELRNYSIFGTGLSVVFMGLCSLVLFFFPAEIIKIFTNDPTILKIGVPIIVMASLFEMVDGYQVSLSGILKGLKMTKTVSACVIAGYWLFGLPFGFLLAYKYDMSLLGFWIGLAISFTGIGIVQQIIIFRKFQKLKLEYK